ncbi:MAG TPA: universal stress protein [Bacillota bacterium]|nr:universal stress protein [Bacillota bacterium]
MLRKVLLAVDGSPSANAAAKWVAGLAERMPGLEVTAVHVVSDPRLYLGVMTEAYASPPPLDRQTLEGLGKRALDAARAALGADVHLETKVVEGPAAEEIVSLAAEGGFELVVMGRRGLNPVAQLVLGSVSERVVHLARCPVVIVRA